MSKPSSEAFASKAPAYLGRSYDEMDCHDLINAMLGDVGEDVRYKGSNHLWRNMAWTGTPEEAVKAFGAVPVGALLFIVEHDGGEVSRGYHDDLGNASHVGVKTGTGKGAIHSSASRGGVFESEFHDKTVRNGGWNAVGLLKQIDYNCHLPDDSPAPENEQTSSPAVNAATYATVIASGGSTVKMRAKPSKRCDLYWEIPIGATVEIRGAENNGWYPVRYGGRDGYMMAEYLLIEQEPVSSAPDDEPSVGVRPSGYAVEIYDLTKEQAEAIKAQYPQARVSETYG